MHTKGLAGQANVFPRDERITQHRKLWFSTAGLANRLLSWWDLFSLEHNVPPRPGRMSFVRAGVDLQSILAKENIVS